MASECPLPAGEVRVEGPQCRQLHSPREWSARPLRHLGREVPRSLTCTRHPHGPFDSGSFGRRAKAAASTRGHHFPPRRASSQNPRNPAIGGAKSGSAGLGRPVLERSAQSGLRVRSNLCSKPGAAGTGRPNSRRCRRAIRVPELSTSPRRQLATSPSPLS